MEKIKTKVRFTSLDVAAMVQNLQRLIGMRATNIYDLNPSTYIIKLAKSDDKALLLIENGVRFHTVEEKETNKTLPSGFTMRFRKFLRSKRLEGVRQVGVERVVVLTFGTEAFTNHLILELYSQGNIILTDNNYKILQCIRSHEFNDKVKTAIGQIYPFEYAAHIYLENIDISIPKIKEAAEKISVLPQEDETAQKKKKKNTNKKQSSKLRDLVFKLIPCLFPAVIENILMGNGIDPDQNFQLENMEAIEHACKVSYKFLKEFLKSEHKGFLYSKSEKTEKEEDMEYFEYSSYENLKFKKNFVEFEFESFDKSIAEYYSKYKKAQHQDEQQFEQIAWKKFEQIKNDQQNRVKKLQEQQQIYKLKAEYIQKNIDEVEAIIKIIKTMENQGYSWDDMKRMVSQSRKNGDPLANMIHELNIHKRQVSVLLDDPSSQDQYCELLPVQINIDYNAYTNATMYYTSKKKNYQKEQRTKEASQQVLKIAEKDALKIIEKKKNEQFQKNLPARKQFWFEKFYWFISSEGILIISGRDSHQNEVLVKKYMKPGDLYMHSDYGGAASTIIKINNKEVGAPRTTLEEAAVFTVCRSKAWDTKILSGAWWVYHDQVSKSAPTGEFLPTGSFMIRGKRNFIQPNRMQMGITFLFKVDQQSAKRHQNDRKLYQQKGEEIVKPTMDVEGEEQFAIISLETNTKTKGAKNQNKNSVKGKQSDLPEMKKLQSKKSGIAENDESDEKDSNSDSQSSDDDYSKKKQIQKKADKKNTKKGNEAPQQPKQRMKNKRKQMKLEKYLQEQDEEERDIIMKMRGAREMKHMRKEDEQMEGDRKNINKKKGKDKYKKKGIQKYIGSQDNQNLQEKLNPDKILFLKKKEDQQQSSPSASSEEENKNAEEEENKDEKIENGEDKKDDENVDKEDDGVDGEKKEGQEKEKQKNEEEEVDEKIVDSEIAELFKLVGKLLPQDNVENLVPMCAPYNSIKQNRFKIKLVPGGLKKGKAARNILHYFLNALDLAEQEKQMIKSIQEQEIINALLGNVKLAGAGLLKMEQKEKAEKKERKKETEKKEKNG